MTTKLAIGTLVKINPEIFKGMTKIDDMGGKIGETPLLKDFVFKVVGYDKTDYIGDFYVCSIHRHPRVVSFESDSRKFKVTGVEGEIRLPVVNCMRVSDKLTLKYSLSTSDDIKGRLQTRKLQEKALFKFRNEKKKGGMRVSSKLLKDNWNEIQSVRKQMIELSKPVGDTVYIDSIKRSFSLPSNIAKSKEKIEEFVLGKISEVRSSMKSASKSSTNKLGIQKIGGVYTKAGTLEEIYLNKVKDLINKVKAPTTDDNYVGIEIECFHKGNMENLKTACVKARLYNVVNIGTDGSIGNVPEGNSASEIRFFSKESDIKNNLLALGNVLYDENIDAGANDTCGLHVHLDMRNRNKADAYHNLFHVQDILFSSQPKTRRSNTYCKPSPKDMKEISDDRYRAINVATDKSSTNKPANTIELRLHQGTVDVAEIYSWVKFLLAVVNLPKLSKTYSSLEALQVDFGDKIDAGAMSYMKERISRFNKKKVAL